MSGGDGDAKKTSTAAALYNAKSFRFPQFDVVQSLPDHHYLENIEQVSTGGGRKWTKWVQKEWKILFFLMENS
ncbi:unnamed protein product [Urochloa humidicola]